MHSSVLCWTFGHSGSLQDCLLTPGIHNCLYSQRDPCCFPATQCIQYRDLIVIVCFGIWVGDRRGRRGGWAGFRAFTCCLLWSVCCLEGFFWECLLALYAVVLKPWTSSMTLLLGTLFFWRWVGRTNVAQHNADAMTCLLLSRTCANIGQRLAGNS